VSQGCRPFGDPLVVTRAEHNLLYELAGRPALEQVLSQARDSLNEEEVVLLETGGLHLGRVINEHKERFERGDFLVRNVMGADRSSGAIAVGDPLEVGTTVQFHLRDAATADEDLHALVQARRADAALVFTCNGRGTRLFGEPHHDVRVLSEHLGAVPMSGFFAAGELGPVGGRNFVHGFTASVALLRDRSTRTDEGPTSP
jgi:small ligand-binding sensory domain FIST